MFLHFSGESAFHSMMASFGWAKDPMVNRIEQMDKTIPITFLYGAQSWIDNRPGQLIKKLRDQSFVNVEVCFLSSTTLFLSLFYPFPIHCRLFKGRVITSMLTEPMFSTISSTKPALQVTTNRTCYHWKRAKTKMMKASNQSF